MQFFCQGALFDAAGRLLLERRKDDGCWGMPAGWVEMGETPADAYPSLKYPFISLLNSLYFAAKAPPQRHIIVTVFISNNLY